LNRHPRGSARGSPELENVGTISRRIPMIQAAQFQELTAPVQKLLSDGVSIALGGFEVSQTQWKKLLETALELGAANARVSVRYAEELRDRVAKAAGSANQLLKEHANLLTDLPKDPVGASQKVIAGYVEASRIALEGGAETLKSSVDLVNDVWSRLEQASHETRESYVAAMGKLQEIVESTAKKN
jgi:hypothetical protein